MKNALIRAHAPTFLLELGPYDDEDLRVVRFGGREALSQPFSFTIELASRDPNLDFERIVGEKATLTLQGASGIRFVHGVAARFQQAGHTPKHTCYEVEIVPRFWLLSQHVTCRIFQDQRVSEIVTAILAESGLAAGEDFEFRLAGAHPVRTYCVQYRESDLDFVSRLLEQEGIFYFFEQTGDREKLIIADHASVHDEIDGDPEVRFAPPSGMVELDEQIVDLVYAQRVCPGSYRMRDFRFEQPTLDLESHSSTDRHTKLEVYDFPGAYEDPTIGASLARVRLEEQQTYRLTATGRGTCLRLAAGRLFELVEHARPEFNQPYLLTEVHHRGAHPQSLEEEVATGGRVQEARYDNVFTVIPAGVPYRPQRLTPRPVVRGSQTAIVVGPPGEEIYTDRHSRVKVKFHWDLALERNEHSSCWIRASQPWAGQGWGALAIPRVGQEVVIDFLEGDPDRPLLTGRVYNGDNVPPQDLPAAKANMTIRSDSLGGHDGSNEITMNDTGGQELFYVHAQRDMHEVTEHDRTTRVGHDDTTKVEHDESTTVEHDQTLTVNNDRTKTVKHDETTSIGNDRTEEVKNDESVRVIRNRTHATGADASLEVGRNRAVKVGAAQKVEIGADASEDVGGSKTTTVKGTASLKTGQDLKMEVGGALEEEVSDRKKVKVGDEYKISAAKFELEADDEIELKTGAAKITLKTSGEIVIQGTKLDITGLNINVAGTSLVDVKGALIQLNC